MLFKVAVICLALSFASSGPHTHKSNAGSKEFVPEGSFNPRDSNHYKDGGHRSEFDHEAILGSHNKAEEFDSLPPAEAKKRLHALALKMDSNKDQFVDKFELMNWVLHSFRLLTEEEALDELEDEDGDEDGKVTWEEHLAETYGMYDDDLIFHHDKEQLEDAEMLQNDKELFKAADINEDGILDKLEYPAFSHPEEFDHMHDVIYLQAMRKRDLNKDGFLSLEEVTADHHGLPRSQETEQYKILKDKFINVLDINGDNKLDKEEVLLWLIPDNIETAEAEAAHLIENSDVDKDGKLSIQEIIDHHEVFVGSEATDFGEQLHKSHHFEDEL